jgi:hypothetical protein
MSVIDDVISGLSHIKRLWMTDGRMKVPARFLAGVIVAVLIVVVGGVVAASVTAIKTALRDSGTPSELNATWHPAAASLSAQPTASASVPPLSSSGRGPIIIGSNAPNAAPVYMVDSSVNAPARGVIQNGHVRNINSYIRGNPVIQNGDIENVGGSVQGSATYDNHGTNNGIIGPNGTIINGPKDWPSLSATDRSELIRALRGMAPEHFFTVASPHAMATAQQLWSDLVQAGWVPVAIKAPGAVPGVVQNGGAPSVYGIKVSAPMRTAAVDYFGRWCVRVGLQNDDPVSTARRDSQDENVNLNFGDPPK